MISPSATFWSFRNTGRRRRDRSQLSSSMSMTRTSDGGGGVPSPSTSLFGVAAAALLLPLLIFGISTRCSLVLFAECSTAASAPTSSSSLSSSRKAGAVGLTLETMNPNLLKMEYAVRGTVVIEADKIKEELNNNSKNDEDDESRNKYGFDKIVYTNIGNPQSVGQKPLTWPRQVLALVDLPDEQGIDHPLVSHMFPEDAIRRAREIKSIGLEGNGSGAYSNSKGVKMFRDDVVSFLRNRDGPEVQTDPERIFLSNGASAAITNVLTALIANPKCGVMIPMPQYPIYSATIDLLGGRKVGYYLDENDEWNLNIDELERSLKRARDVDGTNVVGFVLINPGNPTGGVLSKEMVRKVVQFCADNHLVLLADEVYQENVYDEHSEFYSCKRAAHDTGLLKVNAVSIASFHSTSKGVYGECGRRGGYMELSGFNDDVVNQLYKLASASLCSSLDGQIMTSVMCRGPNRNDPSYESHEREKSEIYESLKRRANIVEKGLTSIPGISCQVPKGAMYCFPSITDMPAGAVEEAQRRGVSPDNLYALSLLRSTGIVVVPSDGFGDLPPSSSSGGEEQNNNNNNNRRRYGFRTTFLPSERDMAESVEAMKRHHLEFVRRYSK